MEQYHQINKAYPNVIPDLAFSGVKNMDLIFHILHFLVVTVRKLCGIDSIYYRVYTVDYMYIDVLLTLYGGTV